MTIYSAIAFIKEKWLYEEFLKRRELDPSYILKKEKLRKYQIEHREEFYSYQKKYVSNNREKINLYQNSRNKALSEIKYNQ